MNEIYNLFLNNPTLFFGKTCEFFGVLFSFIYVVFSIKQNTLCWPALIIAAIFNIPCFIIQELPLQSIMQFFFIITGIYGWYNWKNTKTDNELKVKSWKINKHFEWIHHGAAMTIITTILLLSIDFDINLNFIFEYNTSQSVNADNNNMIWLNKKLRTLADALLFIFNIIPMYLTGKKILESWIYFIIIDMFGSLFYFFDGLYFYAFLYFCYIGFASYGYLTWKKTIK